MVYADGSSYKGQFLEGKMSGKGQYKWPNGVYYDGEWKDDLRHGIGQMFFTDNEPAYRAKWHHDKRLFS